MAGENNFTNGIILRNFKDDSTKLLKVGQDGLVDISSITDTGTLVSIDGSFTIGASGAAIDSIITEITDGLDSNLITEGAAKNYIDSLVLTTNEVNVAGLASNYSVDSEAMDSGSMTWDVLLESASGDIRAERIIAATDGTNVEYIQQTTVDIGSNGDDITLSAQYTGSALHLVADNTGALEWTVYYRRGVNGEVALEGGGGSPAGNLGTTETVREINLTSADVGSSQNIESPVPAKAHIQQIIVKVNTAFNGTTPSLIVGDAGDDDRLVKTTDSVDLTSVDETHVFRWHKYTSSTQLTALISAPGATQGDVNIIVFYGNSAN
jgi:hypothetical protein